MRQAEDMLVNSKNWVGFTVGTATLFIHKGENHEQVVRLSNGKWLVARFEEDTGRWYAPTKEGGHYFGTLDYVSSPEANVYMYTTRYRAMKRALEI